MSSYNKKLLVKIYSYPFLKFYKLMTVNAAVNALSFVSFPSECYSFLTQHTSRAINGSTTVFTQMRSKKTFFIRKKVHEICIFFKNKGKGRNLLG